jgi:hypothetical protein
MFEPGNISENLKPVKFTHILEISDPRTVFLLQMGVRFAPA